MAHDSFEEDYELANGHTGVGAVARQFHNQMMERKDAEIAKLKARCDDLETERAWLVEWRTPGWTDGIVRWHRYTDKMGSGWTTDASLATRYCRKEDADGWLHSMGYDKDGDMVAVEHQWIRAAIAEIDGGE